MSQARCEVSLLELFSGMALPDRRMLSGQFLTACSLHIHPHMQCQHSLMQPSILTVPADLPAHNAPVKHNGHGI